MKSDYYQNILVPSGLKSDSYQNSPWVVALLNCVSTNNSFIYKNSNVFPGRYSCTSLYTALLFLVLKEDKILDTYDRKYQNIQELRPPFGETSEKNASSIQEIWHRSEDYIQLREIFRKYKLDAEDLNEIHTRAAKKAHDDSQANLSLKEPRKSYIAMKKFIKQGSHTIMELYRELTENPVYRQELLKVSGPFQNPDLESELQIKDETTASIQYIKTQTDAIIEELYGKVIGQNDVIAKFGDAYFHREKMVNAANERKGPRHTYLFAGPSGVGKTFVAEIVANMQNIPYKRFDMSAYSHHTNAQDLVGFAPTWKDAKAGVLTEYVHDHPQCVLLFDEIEKACQEVIVLFLQILDEGKCFDKFLEKNIDFRNTIIIFTTNAGKQLYQDAENENLTLLPDTVIIEALKKDTHTNSQTPFFPPEIISRMSSHTIIMFNHLRADAILEIIKRDLKKQVALLKEKYGYDIESGKDMLAKTVLYSFGSSMDARNATIFSGKFIDKALFSFLTLADEKTGLDQKSSIQKIAWKHDFSGASDEIRQFYLGETDCVVAVFGQAEEIQAEKICNETLTENNVKLKITADPEEFQQILQTENVILAAIDYGYGKKEGEKNISITDSQTEGSKIFAYTREEYKGSIPIYILYGSKGYSYSKSEKKELCCRGAREFIQQENIHAGLLEAYTDICCQKTMETLSLRHQRLAYDTKLNLDETQKTGEIIFHNFKLETAVEAEDKKLILSADMQPDLQK